MAIRVTPEVAVDEGEVRFAFARSGGPGGQHVNTTSTKVELRWTPGESAALTPAQRARVRVRLATRLTADGVLILTSSEHRSQTRNREEVLERFAALLRDALAPPPPARRATRPSAAARARRLDGKRAHGVTKALRRRPEPS